MFRRTPTDDQRPDNPTPSKRRSRSCLLLILGFCVAIFFGNWIYTSFVFPSAFHFSRNEKKYLALIERISQMEVPVGSPIYLACNSNWEVKSIRPISGDSDWYQIAASQTKDGRLVVTLIVQNWGHAGLFGYVYCSGPLSSPDEIGPDPWDSSQDAIHVANQGPWSVQDSLPDHWWVVFNDTL